MNKRKILKIGKFESFKKSSEIFIGEWCNDDYLNVSRNHFFDDKSYSLTNYQIKKICKNEKTVSNCINTIREKKSKLRKGDLIEIPVIPYRR